MTTPRKARTCRATLPQVRAYIAELAANYDAEALLELTVLAATAWHTAYEGSPNRKEPLEREVRRELAELPEVTQDNLCSLLDRLYHDKKIRYQREGDAWYVVDSVINQTKPLRRWCYDFLLGVAGLGYRIV